MKVRTSGLRGFALVALSAFAFAACDDKTPVEVVEPPVTVSVTPSSLTLNVGQTAPLVAIVSNATNSAVTWATTTPAVATVSATGVVTAVAPGTAVITATSVEDPTARAAAAVTVNAPTSVVAITLVPDAATITPTGTIQLVPLVTGTTNTAVTYRTSAPTVATVSATGLVTGVAQGTAVITAIASADTTKRATSVITVGPPAGGGVQIAVTPTDATVVVGGTSQFFATVSGSTNTAVIWRSLTPAIATINAQGVATGVAAGTATIQAIAAADTTRRVNATLRVTPAAPPPSISIQNVAPVGPNNTVTGQITATVNVSADVSHDVRAVEIRIDGNQVCRQTFSQPLGTTQGVATITCPINTADTTAAGAPRFPNGPHVLSAVAINGAGTVVAQATYPTLTFNNANVATAVVTFTSSAIGHDGFLWNRGDATVRVRSFIFENIGTNTLSAATVNMHVGGTIVAGVCQGGTVLSQTANAGNNFTVVFAEGTAASNGPLWDITEQDVCFSIGASQTSGGQPITFTAAPNFNQQYRVDNEEPAADPIPADMGLPATALNWVSGTFNFTASAPGAATPGLLANVADDGQSLAGFVACPAGGSMECSGVALPAGVRFFAVPTSTVGSQPNTDEGNAALVAGQTPVTSSSQLNNTTTNDFYTVIAEVRDRVGNVVYVRGPAFGVDRNLPSLSINTGSPLHNSIDQNINPSGGRIAGGTPPAYSFVFADTIGGAQSDFSANPVQVRLTRYWSTRVLCYDVNDKAIVAAGDVIALNDDANRTRVAVAGDSLQTGSPAGCPWITLTTPNAFAFDLAGLPEGYWQVQIRAVDRAGNTTVPSATPGSGSTSSTREHIIDVTAPTAVLPPLQAIATASDSVGLRQSDTRQLFGALPAPVNASTGMFYTPWTTIPNVAPTQIAAIGIANRVLTRSFTLSTTVAAWRGVQDGVGGAIHALTGVGFGVWDIAKLYNEVITGTTPASAHDGAYDALGSGVGFNAPGDLATLVFSAGGATTISNGISRQFGDVGNTWGITIGNGVPTSRTVTVTATGTTAAYRRPFTAVHFYRVDQYGQIFYMGQSGAPSVTFPGGVAAYEYSFSLNTSGVPADLAQEFFAIGVDFNGDAIRTNPVTLVVQGAYQTLN